MTDEDAFLQALFANSADDITRGVYADWLDDNQPDADAGALAAALRGPQGRPRVLFAKERGVPLDCSGFQETVIGAVAVIPWLRTILEVATPLQDLMSKRNDLEKGSSVCFDRRSRLYLPSLDRLAATAQMRERVRLSYGMSFAMLDALGIHRLVNQMMAAFNLPEVTEDSRVEPGLAVWIGVCP